MSIWFIFQWLFDVAVMGWLGWVWLERRNRVAESDQQSTITSEDTLRLLTQAREEIRSEMAQYRGQIAEQLKVLRGVCEQARRILDGKQSIPQAFPPSQEENELKNIVVRKPEGKIPTLGDLESTRQRLRTESSLDLKTLLKEQLA